MHRRVGLVGAFAAVALIALIVILKGFHPSGVITLGDAIVGIGTLTLAVLTGALAVATARVDRNAADRDERRLRRELRDIPRLIDTQLEIVQESWKAADGAGMWRLSLQTPHGA